MYAHKQWLHSCRRIIAPLCPYKCGLVKSTAIYGSLTWMGYCAHHEMICIHVVMWVHLCQIKGPPVLLRITNGQTRYRNCKAWGTSLQWHHNEHDGVSNHQPDNCLLNRLSKCRSKRNSKLRVTGLATGAFPAQRAINEENVSIWWPHHVA